MNHTKTNTIGVMAIMAALMLSGCGKKADPATELKAKQDTAKQTALADYQLFRAATTGTQAESLRRKIKDDLATAGLTLGAINVSDNELQARQSELYNSDAIAAARELHDTHRNTQLARELANKCRSLKDKAGQPVSPALEKGLELAVARNMEEESRAIKSAHGVQPPSTKRTARRPARKTHRLARR